MEKILLLEDDTALGRGIQMALQGDAVQIKLCRTLAQGREETARDDYCLLILDVNLPDGSGLELLRQVRRLYHQALFPGGAPGPGERPAPAQRRGKDGPLRLRRFCVRL